VERFLEDNSLKEIFRGDEFVGGLQEYTDRILMLHHRYLEARLKPNNSDNRLSPDELLRFAEDAEYLATQYTNPLVVERDEELPIEDVPSRQVVQDALALAATIFEFLGDITSLYSDTTGDNNNSVLWTTQNLGGSESDSYSTLGNPAFLYLKSALSYGLGYYESRTHVILKRLLSNIPLPEHPLTLSNCQEWANYMICTLIGSNLEGLLQARLRVKEQVNLIREVLQRDLADVPVGGQHNGLSPRERREVATALFLVEASILGAEAFVSGESDRVNSAHNALSNAVDCAHDLGNYDLIWIIRTLGKVLRRKWSDSPWVRLDGIIERRTYIRKLIDDGVVTLWTSQIAALEMRSKVGELKGGYLDERIKRVVIHMPTSAGKTLLAELAIAQQAFAGSGLKCIYVAPSRALCDQVAADLSDRLSKFGVRVTAMVSDNEITAYEGILFDLSSVLVITPEKLDYLYRQGNSFVHNTGLFIFDELHNIGKQERGWTYEELISLLLLHPLTRDAKMIFLSAVMPNHVSVQEWVDPEKLADTVSELWQPTRLLKGAISFTLPRISYRDREVTLNGDLLYVRHHDDLKSPLRIDNFIQSKQVLKMEGGKLRRDSRKSDDEISHAASATQHFAVLGPVLVYCPMRADTVNFCKVALGRDFALKPLKQEEENQYNELIDYVKDRLPTGHLLVESLDKRIAFHHAGLPSDIRNEIEHAFRQGWIQILAATTTLVEGVNLPVKTLLLADYCMFRNWNPRLKVWTTQNKLSKGDFRNISGRAGRALYETEGQVIFIQSLSGFPFGISDTEFMDYLSLDPDSSELNITSTLAHNDILSELSRLVDEVDNGRMTEEELIFSDHGSNAAANASTRKLVNKLHGFALLTQEHALAGDNETSFIDVCRRTFFSQQRPDQGPRIVGAFSHRSAQAAKHLIASDDRSLFVQTGLKLSTSRTLMARVKAYWEQVMADPIALEKTSFDYDSLTAIAGVIYELGDREVEPDQVLLAREGKGSRTRKSIEDEKGLFAEWVLVHDTVLLLEKYFSLIKDPTWRAEQFVNYTQESFGYRVPWTLSAFLIFSKAIVSKHGIDLSNTAFGRELFLLPAYVKFGVNTPAAAFFSTLGVNPSKLARKLGDLYERYNGDYRYDYQRMLRWIFTLELTTLKEVLASSYIRRLARLLTNLKPFTDELLAREDENIWEATFPIAGWQFYQGDRVLHELREGENLNLVHEPKNQYDQNAVAILTRDGVKLGYVPRHIAKDVAAHLRTRSIKATINKISMTNPVFERVEIHCTVKL
jgi:hypothetical protein